MSSKISEESDDEKDIEMSCSEEDQEAEFGTFDLENTHELDQPFTSIISHGRVSGGFNYGENPRSQSYQNSTMTFFNRTSKRFS